MSPLRKVELLMFVSVDELVTIVVAVFIGLVATDVYSQAKHYIARKRRRPSQ